MASQKIDIVLNSKATGDGYTKHEQCLKRVKKATQEANTSSADLAINVKKLGGIFGQAGGAIGGLAGMLVAVPTAAFLKVQIDRWVDEREASLADGGPTEEG